MIKLRRNIDIFRSVDDEPLHKAWKLFRKLLLQRPTHGIPSHLLLQYFYVSLSVINKSIANQLVRVGIMKQTFAAIAELLNKVP